MSVVTAPLSLDSFKCRKTLTAGGQTYSYYSLPDAEKNGLPGLSKLPFSMKVLIENLLRSEDGRTVSKAGHHRRRRTGSMTKARPARKSPSAPPAC